MSTSPPIAIVGMSSLFAGSQDLVGFWRDIVSATDRLTDVPPHAWLIEDYYDPDPTAPDMTYAKRGGYLDPVAFNPMEFGMPPTTIPATDTAQLLALIAAKRVLVDAGKFSDDADLTRTSVILGVASATELVVEMGSRLHHPLWRNALRQAGLPESRVQEIVQLIKDHYQPWQESTFPGLLGNVVAGRIANRLNLGGSNFVTDAACASSISALQAGLHELYLGDSDMVIAGGVDALNDILMYMCFSKTPAFSPTGDCRPFSEEADGTLIGEGVGMLALRRLEDAERDGDEIYAVIRGLGASSDGKGSSVYAPRPEGQAQALRRAYQKADYSPATVELVEAHGTATKAGDAAEARGLTSVFGPAKEDSHAWCALGSVKSQIGHTKAAAGSAGLIKVALALHHRVLPPTLKVSKPNALLGLADGPLYINTEARPWIRGSDHPRRGSVSSFGFGGSNFHVTMEEYTGAGNRPERLRAWADELVVLSAADRDALAAQLAQTTDQIQSGYSLGLIAADAAEAFDAKANARVAIVASTIEELSAKITKATDALRSGNEGSLPDPDIRFGFGASTVGKLAFVFPGQGSQYVGMGAHAAITFDGARAVWDAAVDMEEFANDRLDRAVFPPPAFTAEERAEQSANLTVMETAQPAIAAVSLGFLHLLRDLGLEADAVAGHSFGELSALAASGRIAESALLATARKRGELMAEAAANTAGAMIAVPSDAETVAGLIDESDNVVIANDNAPTEVVLAGSVEAIDAVTDKLKAAGLRTIRLPVASAFHSSIVSDSCEPFHAHLAGVKWGSGTIDVYANKTADVYPKTAKAGRRLLADQLASPVRFREMVEAMHASGVTHFVEVGPGRVLTKLIGRCLGDRDHVAVSLDDKKVDGLRAFWRGVGALAAEGIEMDLTALSEGYRVPDAPVEAKPYEIMITGFNHDRPYPPENGAAGRAAPNPEVAETTAPPVPSAAPAAAVSSAPVLPPAPTLTPTAPIQPATAVPASAPAADLAMAAQMHHVTIEAHRRYQELMAESHRSFLGMAASALGQTGAVAPGQPVAQPVPQVRPAPIQPEPMSISAPTPAVAVPQPAMPVAPVAAEPLSPVAPVAAEPVSPAPAPAPAVAMPQPAMPVAPVASAPAVDVTAMALEVVSEKTGYPVDMLDLDMEMEAGLGIDSIKQVEILSELQERLPGLPEIAPSELANLRTLRDVADKLSAGLPAGTVPEAAPVAAAAVSAVASAPAVDVTAMALEVVSEKTGYPVDMLDLDMEMEAGLGIDSIKQVEILSELQERLPGLPEIAPSELANLRTLRDVADKLSAGLPAGTVPEAAPVAAAAVSAVASAPAVDVTAMALEVVSEKTGYPVEMLDLDMEMEAGLGIDSIKQVEILSELQERLPGLPEIAPSELANLRTLRDVADKLSAGLPAVAPVAGVSVASAAAPAVASPATPAVDVTAMALEVVSEKTGYPVEMLDLDMEMEAGLGIDSIKQVEILSELQERLPGIPEIAPAELATLRTLRDVADKLSAGLPAVAPVAGVSVASAAAPAVASPATPAVDVTAMALEVVSEKTGYPVEMLDLDMEMEAGLGIDSIKQVEILSELQERLPGIPEIAPAELATLRTLRDVADKLSVGAPATVEEPSAVPADVAVTSPTEGVDVTAMALEVVAEKTGYPVEMLDLDMEMEAGLGIDSIKQVEILSELQERLPGIPEIAPSELASLRTLRDVADKLSGGNATNANPEPVVTPEPIAEAPADAVVTAAPVEQVVEASAVVDPTKITAFVPTLVADARPGFGLPPLATGNTIEVTNEHASLAQALVDGLVARGVSAVVVQEPSLSASAVICLAGLSAVSPDLAGALTVHQSAIQAARLVGQHPEPAERMFVTVQSTGGHFGLAGDPGDGAWTAGLAGVVKTAAREWPGASLKAIDVADPDQAADSILDELFLGGPALEVGFDDDGARSVVQIEPLSTDGDRGPALEPGSVVVVSGGARGVTASSVTKLAEAWKVKLALLGRSKLAEWPEGVPLTTDPVQITGALAAGAKARGEAVDFSGIQKQAQSLAASAEVRMSLADLDARGIEAMYLSADVTSVEEVSTALDHVRDTWGSIDGIVHGAGVLRDKAIVDMTPDRVADVFAPKVGGLAVLLEATKKDPIQAIALFSSIAARAGNAGQAAYSAANEILNKVAANEAARRGEWCRVRSYNWGPWAGGMVDAGLAAHFEKQGIALLGVDAGAQFFADELELSGEGVERVVLAAPSFPAITQSFTLSGGEGDEDVIGSPQVAGFALRLGEALKPVRTMRTYLEDFVITMPGQEISGGVHSIDVQPIEASVPSYHLVFRDSAGDVHHETSIRYSSNGAGAPPTVPSAGLEPWPFEAAAAYDNVLGTATDRRAILNLEGVSEEGGMAMLRSAASLGWPMKSFTKGFDPAAFEGLLQLAELWTHQKSGAMQRLASMGQMVVHSLEAIPEHMRSAFRARKTEKGTLFDFILATEDGDLVAELREVQFDAHGA